MKTSCTSWVPSIMATTQQWTGRSKNNTYVEMGPVFRYIIRRRISKVVRRICNTGPEMNRTNVLILFKQRSMDVTKVLITCRRVCKNFFFRRETHLSCRSLTCFINSPMIFSSLVSRWTQFLNNTLRTT